MEQKHRSLTRKVFLAVLAAVMFIASLCGVMLSSRGTETMTAEPITADAASNYEIKTQITAVKFVNDIGIKIPCWTFNTVNIAGTKNDLSYVGTDSNGDYKGTNKLLKNCLTTLYFKQDPRTSAVPEASDGASGKYKWYWESQNKTSSPNGPYKIETTIYALSIKGKIYLPFGILSNQPFMMGAALLPLNTIGSTITASQLFKKVGNAIPTDVGTVWLPLDGDGWLQWDDAGRPFFEAGIGKRYITVDSSGKPGTTTSASDGSIATKPTSETMPTDSQKSVTDWEQAEGKAPASVGTYDGTSGSHCPVQDSDYFTVSDVKNTTDGANVGDAGTYTATVTPKEGYTWDDGKTDPKTITWTVEKADNNVSLSESSVTFGRDETEKRIPLTAGDLSDLTGAMATVMRGDQEYDGIEARIDTEKKELVLTRKTKDAVEDITVNVTIPASTNYKDKSLDPLTVKLEAGEGFYLASEPNKIYDTLQDAINAAEGTDAEICVRGNVEIASPVMLPDGLTGLTLVGEEGSELVAKTSPLFTVGSEKSLTLEGLKVEAKGSKTLASIEGGVFNLKNSHISGFTQSAVTIKDGNFNLDNGSFFNNSSTWEGGAIFAEGGKIRINGTQFYGNTASGNGGAIYIKNCTMEFLSGSITFNKAKNGGAVYVAESASFQMFGGEIVQNKAENGGGVYVENASKTKLCNVNISLNSASRKGGGVFLSQKGVIRIMWNVQIIDNKGALTDSGTSVDNLFLSAEKCLILEGDITGSKIGISVNMQDESFIICEMGQYVEFPANFLVPDDTTYKIENKNGNVTLCVA